MASVPEHSEEHSDQRRRAVLEAALEYDVKQSPAWRELQRISEDIQLDDVEVDPAGISFADDRFKGVMNLYVLLRFGSGEARVETAESFPGFFEGHFDPQSDEAVIDGLAVKTASFYA